MAAGDELQLVTLRDDFYRDGYYKALIAVGIMLVAIALLASVSLYLQLSKPAPVVFATGDEFRTLIPVPVNKTYVSAPDLIQWVSDVLPKSFKFDFINYNLQLKNVSQYFTVNGWKTYLDLVKIYADYNVVTAGKLFISAIPAGAPFILNQGLLPEGVYGWLVQMPITLSSRSVSKGPDQTLVLQALVVRISTLNNLSGIAIDKLTLAKAPPGDQATANG